MSSPKTRHRRRRPRRTDFFDRWSASYDRPSLQALTYRPIHQAMLRSLRRNDAPITAILDLGCGTGQFLRPLTAAFPNATVHGLDLSPGMLAEAATRAPSGTGLVRGDAQQLPFAPASFDAITCSESFHWYPDQQATAEELRRVLRPNGVLLIASVAAATDAGDRALRRWSTTVGQPMRALPPRRLRTLLERSGFEVHHQRRLPRLGLVPWPVLTECRPTSPSDKS